jgi:hypothetical protein
MCLLVRSELKGGEMSTAVCDTSSIKRRRTKAEIESIKEAIYSAVEANQPVTCRQAFYLLVSTGVVEKTEAEYRGTVCRLMADMRRADELPWGWVADNTRWMRKPDTHDSLGNMLHLTAQTYRRALWNDQDCYVEIWLEKDALAGVLWEVTAQWDVPLMVTRGYASLSFLWEAAETIWAQQKPAYLYLFSDHDPSGVDLSRAVKKTLHEFAADADIHFQRVAVTEAQIEQFDLPTRPTKKADTRAKKFNGESVEVDAIPPDELRQLCRDCITRHVDLSVLQRTEQIEAAERETLQTMLNRLQSEGE